MSVSVCKSETRKAGWLADERNRDVIKFTGSKSSCLLSLSLSRSDSRLHGSLLVSERESDRRTIRHYLSRDWN